MLLSLQVGDPWDEGGGVSGAAINFSVRNLGGFAAEAQTLHMQGCKHEHGPSQRYSGADQRLSGCPVL